MSAYLDLKGTSETSFNVGLSSTAVKLKNDTGVLHLKNKADNAFVNIKVSELFSVANQFTLNDNATLAGADWKMLFARPVTGMTASVTYTFPAAPTNGYFLTTDGSGNLSWAAVSSPSVTDKVTVNSTSITPADFGGPPITAFTLPGLAVIHRVEIIVDSAFTAGSEVSVNDSARTIMSTSQSDLTDQSRFVAEPNLTPFLTSDNITISFTGSPIFGTARVLVFYSIPA